MNDNKLKKQANNKHAREKLQEFSVFFEETPQTVFKSKWLKNLSRNVRKLRVT